MKKIFLIIFLVLIIPIFVSAQNNTQTSSGCGSNGNLGSCVNQIYVWSMGAAALLALVMIVLGGYVTLTAAGNAERASRGKNYITSSVVGLVLLFGAYLLLRTINPDLVDFRDSCATNISRCTTPNNNPPWSADRRFQKCCGRTGSGCISST